MVTKLFSLKIIKNLQIRKEQSLNFYLIPFMTYIKYFKNFMFRLTFLENCPYIYIYINNIDTEAMSRGAVANLWWLLL